MKISLITTVYNEEENIESFIKSIFNMSRLPDEVIIVDAGSKDNTIKILNELSKRYKQIKILVKEKCNIAEGRNIAIKNSKFDIIAVTDAGCKINKDWLKEIIKPFEDKEVHVVSGWYEPLIKNNFERYTVPLLFPKITEVNSENFLPSSRSIAFRKAIYNQSGGYPEFLTFAGEDTLFDLKLKKLTKLYFAKNAIVYWEPRNNIKNFIKQIVLYSIGDGEAGIFKKMYYRKIFDISVIVLAIILAVVFNNVFTLSILLLLFLYKYKRIIIKNFTMAFVTIPLFFIMEVCQIIGFIKGSRRSEIVTEAKKYLDGRIG